MLDGTGKAVWRTSLIRSSPFDILLSSGGYDSIAKVSVLITCYNYGNLAKEALASVLLQTEPLINIVVVDDCSSDDSASVIAEFLSSRLPHPRVGKVDLIRHTENQGLSHSRNTALSVIHTPFVFILDADNQLYPRAIEVLRTALETSGDAMSYSLLEQFGEQRGILNNSLWLPQRFQYGNYIDAMALIRMDALRQIGGYRSMPERFGWEDYDLWCSFVDLGLRGCHVPQILGRYRIHNNSMIRVLTDAFVLANRDLVREDFRRHHGRDFFF